MANIAEEPYRIFGGRLRRLRIQLEWSQEKLAFESGLDRSYVGGVERGERNISLGNIYRLAKALGVPAKALFEPVVNEGRSGTRRRHLETHKRRDKSEQAKP